MVSGGGGGEVITWKCCARDGRSGRSSATSAGLSTCWMSFCAAPRPKEREESFARIIEGAGRRDELHPASATSAARSNRRDLFSRPRAFNNGNGLIRDRLRILPCGRAGAAGEPIRAPITCAHVRACRGSCRRDRDPAAEDGVGGQLRLRPLQTALASGEFREADCITRAALITIAGEAAVKRGYVYFTEVPKLPVEDMATIERLWQAYSDGKFGYSVQRQAFISKKVNENFENFFERIGWKNKAGSLLRWLPEAKNDEFIYDAEKAPKGHLPLTSALRGTQLLNGLLTHPAWETEGKRSRLRLAQFLLHTHLISSLFFPYTRLVS